MYEKPQLTEIIQRLEQEGIRVYDFKPIAFDFVIAETSLKSIELHLGFKADNCKRLDKKNPFQDFLEEKIMIEFKPIYKQEYDCEFSIIGEFTKVDEIYLDKIQTRPDILKIFEKYKQNELYRTEIVFDDIIKYAKIIKK
ncbi:hypothetical protein JXM83_05535 [Candidatus Woesearchaeota archaeon]|nr:hypothetical protein [Candidatus Woesearchaeota archaeon]